MATSAAMQTMACGDDEPSGPVLDTASPEITIVFPANGEYDRDNDGLTDIEIAFADSGRGLDPASITVTSSRPLGPGGAGGTDLLASFETVEQTCERLVLEESTDALLPNGAVEIIVTAGDSAGNTSRSIRAIALPAGTFHALLNLPSNVARSLVPRELVMLPDGSKGFVSTDAGLVQFNPWSLKVLPVIPGPIFIFNSVYDPTTERVYFADQQERFSPSGSRFGLIAVFDPSSNTFETPIEVSARPFGIDRSPSGLLFVALSASTASVSVVDPGRREEIRVIDTGVPNGSHPEQPVVLRIPRVAPEEDRLFVGLPVDVPPFGLAVIDLASGKITKKIDFQIAGLPSDAALDVLRRRLYVSSHSTLVEVDLDTDSIRRRIDRPRNLEFLSLSPSGQRLFVASSTFGATTHESWLVDVRSLSILERFSVAGQEGEKESVFRPDGQLVFSNRGRSIAVYLNRES